VPDSDSSASAAAVNTGIAVGRGDAQGIPLLRGVLHQYAFFLALVAGVALVAAAPSGRGEVAAAVFAATIASMFAASALFHRVPWTPRSHAWMGRVDHAAIYLVIAGGYTAVGLVALAGAWRVTVFAVVWSGVLAAIILRFTWHSAPAWLTPAIGVSLGWVSLAIVPHVLDAAGVGGFLLLLAGGVFYTVGSVVYVRRRPNPWPRIFGYHELFHAFVVVAVLCHYASVAFFLLPRA
jgi:hemolysin III